ncbi:MAG: histidine phosphatase family protein [Clostridia bacterium]|nr:histidine phosphatase family protein [Clostridia bacterium]
MTTLLLIRHGQTEYNNSRRFTGQNDIAMSPHGYLQVKATAEHVIGLYHVDAVYSSDLQRAMNTVDPIAKHFALSVKPMRELRETDVGAWQDRFVTEISEHEHELFALYENSPGQFRFPGGENYRDVQARALRAVRQIAAEQAGRTVAVGTHGGLIRALCCAWLGYEADDYFKVPIISNASITVAEIDGESARLKQIGDNAHLEEINKQKTTDTSRTVVV